MQTHVRWLFGIAAAANLQFAAGLLFFRSQLASPLALDPVTGTNLVWLNLAAGLVALFGVTYAMVAVDPARYRPYIALGIAGKLLAVCGATLPWGMTDLATVTPAHCGRPRVRPVVLGLSAPLPLDRVTTAGCLAVISPASASTGTR